MMVLWMICLVCSEIVVGYCFWVSGCLCLFMLI